ncbi:hypothetical protein Tco_1139300 [Tanacetum coccineum]
MHRSTPRAHRTPILTASPQGKKRKQGVGESSSLLKSLKITNRQKKVVDEGKDDNDSEDRIEPGSHKDNLKNIDDDDDEEKVDKMKVVRMGSLETRNEKMQTPIPTTPRSPRKILSSDKKIDQQLTDGYMIQDMERKCVITAKFWETHNKVDEILHEVIPQLAEEATNDLVEYNLKPCIAKTIIEDRDAFKSEVPALGFYGENSYDERK